MGSRRAARSGGPAAPPRPPSPALSRRTLSRRTLSRRALLAAGAAVALTGCGASAAAPSGPAALRVGAIPDQDPEVLQRVFGTVADAVATALDLQVTYTPVTDYAAAVSLFRTGDLDLVWFGGLTGVQARLQTPGARPVAQRDIDRAFTSVFVVNAATGLAPSGDLAALAPLRFTYGSPTSTSGRLMPAWFLREAGVDPDGFPGGPGFAGSHDATLALVASGTYEAGVLNAQVWRARTAEGAVDPAVVRYAETPPYADYHWLLHPAAAGRTGVPDLHDRLVAFLTGLPPGDPVLDLLGAGAFVPVQPGEHDRIEQVGRELGLLR
ncbi:putative selenate ABC transporter substrate-binding protein [Geodermatophilus sp. DSM 44513]|uniref:putative selenate ABC transporter substrate-binding protein n=1 Tax=Geodermatophilus sp. DSM 44513 TaxID=1528104 RepID=UPI001274DC84|nr:putative selenate ABC transporter substrate-binding protein [Geodermatophilus sp. DSM 44513]WNV77016.1 putative selenate ABC transporter substrate-binding protein [Geodermatophilus sp. DSM 44513]